MNPKQNPNNSHCTQQMNSGQTANLNIKDKTIYFLEENTRDYLHTTDQENIIKQGTQKATVTWKTEKYNSKIMNS